MPARPANITNVNDLLPTINQLLRELQIRIDSINKARPPISTLTATSTLDFGTIAPNSSLQRNIRVAGASQKASVSASPQLSLSTTPLAWSAQVSGTDLVTVTVVNHTSSPIAVNTVKWNTAVTQ